MGDSYKFCVWIDICVIDFATVWAEASDFTFVKDMNIFSFTSYLNLALAGDLDPARVFAFAILPIFYSLVFWF
jgi:hypothetical protein